MHRSWIFSAIFLFAVGTAAAVPDTPACPKKRVKMGRAGQLIIGGFDPDNRENYMEAVRELEKAIPQFKSIGATSHEGYVRWNLCELEPGRYDWTVYDAFVDVYKRHHLKWVPFLIVGPAYSLPNWYHDAPESQGYVCLEHHTESAVESLWNPALRAHLAQFIEAFCNHYRDTAVIESILLGITGNYGEAIYIATGNDWTSSVHGQYHTHPGFWAGDPLAVKDFQAWLQKKYFAPENLNDKWKTAHAAFTEITPFPRDKAPNRRAWLDFCQWYFGSMNDYCRFWLQEVRKHFSGEVNLCTGGHAPAEHGSDFGEQCKVAAEFGGGVRITNEGSNYRDNFSLTRWVASAGLQYGAYFSFEPAGPVNPEGVIARIYGATASGARGLHYYYGNIFGPEAALADFVRWGRYFQQRRPVIEIAVHYPQTSVLLHEGNPFLGYVKPLRDRFDFAYVSDQQILDGGLNAIRALILLWGNVAEEPVWRTITEWVQGGGVLMYPTEMGVLRTVEDDDEYHCTLFGPNADLEKGRVQRFYGDAKTREYRDFLSTELATAPELTRVTRRMLKIDGKEDNVYATTLESGKLLWLNYSVSPKRKGNKTLPPMSIGVQ